MATVLRQSLKVISSRLIHKLICAQKVSTREMNTMKNAVSDVQKTLQLNKASPPLGCYSYHSEGMMTIKFAVNIVMNIIVFPDIL